MFSRCETNSSFLHETKQCHFGSGQKKDEASFTQKYSVVSCTELHATYTNLRLRGYKTLVDKLYFWG